MASAQVDVRMPEVARPAADTVDLTTADERRDGKRKRSEAETARRCVRAPVASRYDDSDSDVEVLERVEAAAPRTAGGASTSLPAAGARSRRAPNTTGRSAAASPASLTGVRPVAGPFAAQQHEGAEGADLQLARRLQEQVDREDAVLVASRWSQQPVGYNGGGGSSRAPPDSYRSLPRLGWGVPLRRTDEMSAFGATSIRGRGDQYSAPFGHGASHNAIPGTLRGMPHRRGNAAGAHALRLALRDGDFTADDYEQLLALDRLQPRESKGLTRQQLASIPTQKGARHAHEPDCVICVEPVKKRQVCLSLPCTHEFHAQCIKKWLAQNPTCPICKGAYSV